MSSDENPQNPGTETVQGQPTNEIQQSVSAEGAKPSPPSVFVNSEPMREDQVQNAVKFLSHPKVKGSPVMYRRSFLEKKGLTREEIDEAFRRVPDPPPSVQATSFNQDGQVKLTANVQAPVPSQALQPAVAAPSGVINSAGTLVRSRFHWYHAIIAVGLLAASGAGTAVLVKNAILPRLKSWIRKVVLEEEDDTVRKIKATPSLVEEAAAAAAAAADVAKASQEMLNSKNEDKRYFEELTNLLDVQVREIRSMSTSIRNLEGQTNNLARTSHVDQQDHRFSVTNPKQTYANGKAELDSRSARSSSPPASTEPSSAPHPKSYMEIMAMVQRGEKLPNIRDINDLPPNPNQQISNPRVAPRTKPWDVSQAQNGSSQVLQSQASGESLYSTAQENGMPYQLDNESTGPWWQQKNARITEIENGSEFQAGPYGGERTSEQPARRAWTPPQPPPVAMPEAAEAIRRPKPSVQKEQLPDQSTSVIDELQRITKISESGGVVETNGVNTSEIQEEQEASLE